jgi:hypothetical protein
MRKAWCVLILLCNGLLLAVQFSEAAAGLRVNELATTVSIQVEQLILSMAVENSQERDIAALVKIDLVDPRNRVRATAGRDETIKPGSSTIVLSVPLGFLALNHESREQLLWFRLRYEISERGNTTRPIEGILSLSETTPELFELHVATSRQVREGTRYRAVVRTTHPVLSRPVSGVAIEGEIKFDVPRAPLLKSSGVTDSDGYVSLDFDLPENVETTDAKLKVTGRLGGLVSQADDDIRFDRFAQILTSTDKPLYQPGQTLHVRALAFDSSNHAIANQNATLKIQDSESTLVFRAPLKTSRFGVANADWPIPNNARLGQYMVLIEMDDGKYQGSSGGQWVSISRYDLPNFVVNVKPDRAYYLPGQNAEVEVRADYLFGQPIKHGHVRVVRETERKWNFKEQNWDIEEGGKCEGEIDEAGRFIARMNLDEEHRKIANEDYARFRDIDYAAYLSDSTTNRTEQRRFRLRVTKEPIHIYVFEEANTEEFPLQFYVSTFYPDGAPAQCEVTVAESPDSRLRHSGVLIDARTQTPRTIKTNRYGVAKVTELTLSQRERVSTSRYNSAEAILNFTARDARGQIAHHTENFWFGYRNKTAVRVETGKALYRTGEPIEAKIAASKPDLSLIVDVARDSRVVRSQVVRLREGRASFLIPYSEELKDEITIVAYTSDEPDQSFGSRTVLFPRDRDLKLDVKLGQSTYRPGEEASADFRVLAPGGRPVESALGVVVFDKAVEERSRTNQEFGRSYGFYDAFVKDDELAGVSRKDLDHIDLSKPLSDGFDLVAEMLLNRREGYSPRIFGGGEYQTDARQVFGTILEAQMRPIRDALTQRYSHKAEYPQTDRALLRLLREFWIDFGALHDPWGTPYHADFSVAARMDVLDIVSAGADKRFGTADDFTVARMSWPYFRLYGEALGRAIEKHHARTGGYIRDLPTLRRELASEGVDLRGLRDPWGKPYAVEFGISGTFFTVNIKSSGPNEDGSDGFLVWTGRIDYFNETRAKIDAALTSHFKSSSRFPQNETEFIDALRQAGVEWDNLRDPWGGHYYTGFRTEARYTDRVTIQSYAKYNETPKERTEVIPLTRQVNFIYVRSAGADGKEGTEDDFSLVTLSRVVAEQASKDSTPKPARGAATFSGSTGVISGLVVDPSGAVVAGTRVTANHIASSLMYETRAQDDGRYTLENLPAGLYEVRFYAAGFSAMVLTDVPVLSSNVTELNATLHVGAVSETVTVTASRASVVETSQSQVSGNVQLPTNGRNFSQLAKLQAGVVIKRGQMATPRLREYFPETLVWQPSMETDSDGRAQLKFKLADNITTWKVGVVASTVDGQIALAEEELRAFQPFFIEHDPPQVLTEGDEIALPVVLRNYLDKTQVVDLEIKPAPWFTLVGPAHKRSEIAAGDAAREVFNFRAVSSTDAGKQRVIATGLEASDAVEKPVRVHPNGEEITETATQVFTDSSTIEVRIPDSAIKGTLRGELKIYPNLMAHLTEGIEGIIQRPYGCAEQTISSAYPSLMVLRYYKRSGEDLPRMAEKARRYLQAGYERLLNHRNDDGGFTYWGRGEADSALTAYALRFLNDAREFVAVDEDVIDEACDWLVKHQRVDGSFPARSWSGEDRRQTASLTSFVARVLASRAKSASKATDADSTRLAQACAAALKRALDYLASRTEEIDEPYAIASYALAAINAGDTQGSARSISRLRSLAHEEGGASYWALETNTPFYGWGLAGRIEATALGVQALALGADAATGRRGGTAKEGATASSARPQDELVNRGLLFLLRQKDRYGVWYSTQATVNVLDALVTVLEKREPPSGSANAPAEVFVNDKLVTSVAMPPSSQLTNPIRIDLSQFLSAGANRIQIRRGAGVAQATAQVVASHYEPWTAATAARAAGSLHLRVSFDKSETKIGDEVTCSVEAERVGFRGYGMMLAEIGLPPGADADRASLERAVKESGWGVEQYDVLPDRLIVYLWPQAGGTRFQFKFRPRFGLTALTAPSVVYDYYNPEARAVVAPARFIIK